MHHPYTHTSSLATSTALSEYYVENFIRPLDVITVLNEAGVRFMLVGMHGIGGWMQKPRATEDLDVLVAARSHKKTVKALLDDWLKSNIQSEIFISEFNDERGITQRRDFHYFERIN